MDDKLFENGTVNNELDAYLLGFLYADGYITRLYKGVYNSVGVTLSVKDEAYLKIIACYFHSKITYSYTSVNGNRYKCVRFCKHDPSLVKVLINLGVIPHKTYEISDRIISSVPSNLIHHFIRGFFDGDGSIYQVEKKKCKASYGIGFVTFNRALLEHIQTILSKKCELPAKAIRMEKEKYARLNYGGNVILDKIKKFLYSDATIFLERKKKLFDKVIPVLGRNGYRGVRWLSKNKKWTANYKRIYLGIYEDKQDAINCIRQYEQKHFPIGKMDAKQ